MYMQQGTSGVHRECTLRSGIAMRRGYTLCELSGSGNYGYAYAWGAEG